MAHLAKRKIGQYVVIAIVTLAAVVYAVSRNPDHFFGLGASNTCSDYNGASPKYRAIFPDSCGCLYPNQAAAVINSRVKTTVLGCFERKVHSCRSDEHIGDIYRGCVRLVTGIPDGD